MVESTKQDHLEKEHHMETTTNTISTAAEILSELGIEATVTKWIIEIKLPYDRQVRITTQDEEGHLRITILHSRLIEAEIDASTINRQILKSVLAASINYL
jgi:hypothetical protein